MEYKSTLKHVFHSTVPPLACFNKSKGLALGIFESSYA